MQKLKGKHILIGVTGGIAAYKTAILVRLLIQEGAEVRVVMTPMARDFITPLTMATLSQHPVFVDMFDATNGSWNSHVSLGTWADLFVVAPATANTIAKFVSGIADNLLCTTFLSVRCPVLVAPAMDLDMFSHVATQANLSVLRQRCLVVEPTEGFLASGLEGKGRMAEPHTILSRILEYFQPSKKELIGKNILVTSGPTRESIDPVRYVSNRSTGLMGAAICEALAAQGAEVYCVAGPCSKYPSSQANIHVAQVETAEEMLSACLAQWPEMHAGIMAAAVADYRVKAPSSDKIRHTDSELSLTFEPCPDIAKTLGAIKTPNQVLVGFALETDSGERSAMSKLQRKNLDLCILNSLCNPGAGFGCPTNKTSLYFQNGEIEERPLESKELLAQHIALCVSQLLARL